jgi:hypothetical protein
MVFSIDSTAYNKIQSAGGNEHPMDHSGLQNIGNRNKMRMNVVDCHHSRTDAFRVLSPLSFGEGLGVRHTAPRTLPCHIHIHFHFHSHSHSKKNIE